VATQKLRNRLKNKGYALFFTKKAGVVPAFFIAGANLA
jgi:hypothetical protein